MLCVCWLFTIFSLTLCKGSMLYILRSLLSFIVLTLMTFIMGNLFFFSSILLSVSEYSNKIIIVISLDKLWDLHEYGELNKAQGIEVSYSPHCLPILCLKIHKY